MTSIFGDGGVSLAQLGGVLRPPVPSGQFTGNIAFAFTDAAMAANTLYGAPWICPTSGLYDQIGVRITTGAAGNCKMGVYSYDATNLFGQPLAETDSDQSTAATGAFAKSFVTPLNATAGQTYFLCFVCDATPSTRGYPATTIQGGGFSWLLGSGTGASKWTDTNGNLTKVSAPLTYVAGASFFPPLPASTGLGFGSPGAPILAIRKA